MAAWLDNGEDEGRGRGIEVGREKRREREGEQGRHREGLLWLQQTHLHQKKCVTFVLSLTDLNKSREHKPTG